MKFLTFILLLAALSGFSQNSSTNSQLALMYYQNKDFEKASVFYKELFEQTGTQVYFEYYIKCLTELENFDEAEKFIKKLIKKDKENFQYQVELGNFYKQQKKLDKAEETYAAIIKKLPADYTAINNVANAFLIKGEFDWAEKTYLQAKKSTGDKNAFSFELANVYFYQRNYTKMIDEYLNLLDESDSYIANIQNKLQAYIYDNTDKSLEELLKTNLLKRIQKNPSKEIFSELLIWLYIQEKDFYSAFIQSKAIDKRNKESGERIIQLGAMATTNKQYDIAVDCYKYVLDKGKNSEFYLIAKNDYVNAMYKKVIITGEYTPQELKDLEANFTSALEELGFNTNTFTMIINLAHLQAFYLQKSNAAIELLEKASALKNIKPTQISECKIELADVLLMSGDPWQATLLYAQADKAEKDNPIGFEAKFKKARLAYYNGDFSWAKAQLDVLKASTSKLIANDALDLALLISENSGFEFDTTDECLKIFARADMLEYKNQDSLALTSLDSITRLYPDHPLADDILFKKYEIALKKRQNKEAQQYLETIIEKYSSDVLADKAMYYLGLLMEDVYKDPEKAKEIYKSFLNKFPGSIYVSEVRKNYRRLRGDNID